MPRIPRRRQAPPSPRLSKNNNTFWREWCAQMQRDLASNLADTIGEKPSKDGAIYECVNKLIDVEQTLAAIVGR